MATYSINPLEAEVAAGTLQRTTAQLNESIETLRAGVNNFMAANQGSTVAAYAEAQRLFDEGNAQMRDSLARAQQSLRSITQNYVDTDNGLTKLFS